MENNNKISISLNTVILIGFCILALVVGVVCYFIFNNKTNTPQTNPEQLASNDSSNLPNNNSSIIDTDNNNNSSNNSNNSNNSNISNNNSNNSGSNSSNNSSNNNNNSNSQTSTSSSNNSSINAKSSTKDTPLSIGEWGIASQYSAKQYTDLPVKVTNVVRGNAASQRVRDYCNSGSIYKYEDPKENMEWAVIEYTVDLTNAKSSTNRKNIRIDSKISGTGNNSSIKYNGYTYITSVMNMTTGDTTENIATGYFATQLPIGCTDYLIVLGVSSNTQAFFSGM